MPPMHPSIVAAWIRDLELYARTQPPPSACTRKRRHPDTDDNPRSSKTRRVVLGEIAANDDNMITPPPNSNASRPKKSNGRKRMRTPSPSNDQRQFPDGSYSPSDIDEPIEADDDEPIEEDDDDFQSRSPTESYTQSQSSESSAYHMKITSLDYAGNGVRYTPLEECTVVSQGRREQLGESGFMLLEKLQDVSDGPAVPVKLKEQLAAAKIKIPQRLWDTSDQRPVDELLYELRTIRGIISMSHRCSASHDHTSEWNNRVHTRVLELALGNDETSLGFESIAAARIRPEYHPSNCKNFTTGNVVDYVVHLEPFSPARNTISSLIRWSTESINHIGYEGIRARPIAVAIETRTKTRSMEEAQVRLGVWAAAQVARIEDLMRQRASLVDKNVTEVPDLSRILSQTVFPLIDVECGTWTLFLARVTPSSALPKGFHKPMSNIRIFESVPLGNTMYTLQTYRLVKSLRVLRDWVDGDFRKWWDGVLGIADVDASGA